VKAWKLVGGVAVALIAAFALITLGWVNTPLHKGEMLFGSTVSRDYSGMAEWIRRGADVDFRFDGATSSLQAAIESQDAKAAAILLAHGASLRTLSGHYERALAEEPFRAKVISELRAMGREEKWPKSL
jgi:hypothetical protein